MKIILILLALGLCFADAVPGGYQPIDITEAQADATIQSYIQTGLDAVVQNAVKKGFFSHSNFALTSLTSVAEQVVNGANYKFDCNFTDSNGVVIQADFVVHQSASTNATTVTSFAYKVYYPPTTTTITTTTTTTTTPTTTVDTEEDNSVEEEESGETAQVESTESGESSTEVAENGESDEADTTTTTTTVAGQDDTETATTTTTDAATNSTETSTEASVNNTTAPSTNETEVSPNNGFTPISADEFSQSDDLRNHFTFGFENVVQNGIISGKIPNVTFTSAKVLGASFKTLKNGALYKFTAEASNEDGVDLELGFQVSYRVPAYSYKVTITTTTPSNNTDDNSTTPVDTGAGSGSDNTTTPVDTGAGSDNTTTPVDNGSGSDNNTTAPVDNGSGSDNNSTTPVDTGAGSDNNTTAPVVEWTAIDLAQAQQSAEIQANIAQGFDQVIQTVVQKKLLAADNYTITQLVAASYHNLTKGVNYKFTVKANNDDQTLFLDMNFTTYYRYSNKSVKTVSYHYNYYTKAAPVQNNTAPAQNNTTPAQNDTTPVAPVQNTTTPAQNDTTPAQNTTTPAQNNTTPAQNDNGYVALSATEIQAQDVQNAINYGSNQVVQVGIQKNKIPSDTYTITNVASVLKKIQPSGANYNATVTLKSTANVTVNTNFNVYYNSTSNAMILKAYSYGVTGIKKNNGKGNDNSQ